MSATSSVRALQLAVRIGDTVILRNAVEALQAAGYTPREMYRLVLARTPGMTYEGWQEMLERAVVKGMGE